jgi:hypothetical protein
MDAAILHAEGDETLASGIAAKLAPADTFAAGLRGDAGVTLGDKLALFAIWSARADAQGLGQALSRVAARAQARCVVVRADGTPLPPLPIGARVVTAGDTPREFAYLLAMSQPGEAPAPVARGTAALAGLTPGLAIGLSIYSGMFFVAGAWRSDEVSDAIESGKAVAAAGAIHSFNVATAAAINDAVQVAQLPGAPTASFVQPQRVTLTAALDTTNIPIVAADAVPLADARTAEDDYVAPPVRLHAVDAESIIATASFTAPVALDVGANSEF